MRYRYMTVLPALVFMSLPLDGHADYLRGEELRRLVLGKRVYISTPLGGEIPLYYAPNGTVSGSGETVGLGRWFKPRDNGVWWINGDRLCQRWQEWYHGRTFCFTATLVGASTIQWIRSDGKKGSARVIE